MTTAYPAAFDVFTNPTASDNHSVAVGGRTHSAMHADTFDAIAAIQARLGITGSAVTTSDAYKLAQIMGSAQALSTAGGTITQAVATSGSPAVMTFTGAAHTTLAASTEASDFICNFARTVQFATGALATQRTVRIQAPTYSFVGASTITNAATFAISGAPAAGANATITNAHAFWVQAGRAQFDGIVRVSDNTQSTNNSTGAFVVTGGLGVSSRIFSAALTLVPGAQSGVTVAPMLLFNGAANTNTTASTELNDVNFNFNRTTQFATGALTNQRTFRIQAATYAFVGASTITNAATVAISGAPSAGANATITNSYALWVEGGISRFVGVVSFDAAVNTKQVTLTDAASITTDASLGNGFTVTLGGNRTLANPTNLVAGSTYLWQITQDGTGTRTLAYGNLFKWPGGAIPVLSTAIGAVDVISAYFDGSVLRAVAQMAFA